MNAGHILKLNCTIQGNNIIIVNLYAPTKDKLNAQNQFLESLKNKLECYRDKYIIIGGDVNVCLDPIKDEKGDKKETMTEYSKNLQYFMDEFSLVDIWRQRNKNATLFTR